MLGLSGCLTGPIGAADPRSIDAAGQLIDLWVEQQLEYRDLPGLAIAVVQGDRVVWSNAYGWADREARIPMTGSTRFRVGSVSKLFTSTAVMQLRDEGRLGLEDPISTFIADFPTAVSDTGDGADAPPARLRDLLTHTSGLRREAPFPYWTDHVFPDRDQLLDSLQGQELVAEPGSAYRYSNFGMGILGEVIATVSGMPYAEFLAARLFEPLGLERSTAAPTEEEIASLAVGYMRRRPDGSRGVFEYYDTGALAAAGNVVSTVDELARFAALQLGALADTEGVIAASTLREMQRVHWLRPSWTSGRGLGFSVSSAGGETLVSHGGWIAGHRTHFLLVPEQRIGVVAFVNADDGQPYTFAQATYDTFAPALRRTELEAADEAADGAADEGAPPDSAEPAPDWSRYLGRYADPWEWEYRAIELDGGLVLYDYSYPPADDPRAGATPLERVSGDAFRLPDGDPVVFDFAEDGTVSRVQRRVNYLFPLPPPVTAPRPAAAGGSPR